MASYLILHLYSFQHALGLPGFLFMAKDIYNHAVVFSASGKVLDSSFLDEL